MVKNKTLTKSELLSRGLVEITPGVYKKESKPQQPIGSSIKEIIQIYKQTGSIIFENLDNSYLIEFPVDPMGKPRMTQSDKWKKREVTDRYWQLKDNMKKIAEGYNFIMPESDYHMIFNIPMPKSWSKKKKSAMNGKPHKQKPDKDNLEKAVLDALCEEDSYVWDGRVSKLWSYKGSIIIKNLTN